MIDIGFLQYLAKKRAEKQRMQPHKRYLLFDTTEHFATGIDQVIDTFDTLDELKEGYLRQSYNKRDFEGYDRLEGIGINLTVEPPGKKGVEHVKEQA